MTRASNPSQVQISIAIDGPAASGKGTVARTVARALGYSYVDTGTLYRTLAYVAAGNGLAFDDGEALATLAQALRIRLVWNGAELVVLLGEQDVTSEIRTEQMGTLASRVSALPQVRGALLAVQRAMAAAGGVVMDGRDIGSVVLPNADLKVFLDASLDERTRRRQSELEARGIRKGFQALRDEMATRDALDRQRQTAPLVRLPEAFYLDTTGMSAGDAARLIIDEARRRGA